MRKRRTTVLVTSLISLLFASHVVLAQSKPRARDLGIPFDGIPGPLNAINDVRGVEVGHTTLISGEGKLVVGKGPIRTGVTAVLPRGKSLSDPVFAGWFSQNGNGEMTGTTWVEESGFLEGPVMITPRKEMEEKIPCTQIPDPKKESTGRAIRSSLESSPAEPRSRWRCHLQVLGDK